MSLNVETLADDGYLASPYRVARAFGAAVPERTPLTRTGRAVKVRVAGGEPVYAIPELAKERVAPEEHIRRVLGEWVVEVAHSGNLVVLRTPPGSANLVANALDAARLDGVAGTIAGDDTIFIATTSADCHLAVCAKLGVTLDV